MAKFTRLCYHTQLLYSNPLFIYPYRSNGSSVYDSEKLYPPIPYYIGDYLVKDVDGGLGLSYSNSSSGSRARQGIYGYEPIDMAGRFVGITSNSYNNTNTTSQTVIAITAPVCMVKHDGELSLPGSNTSTYNYLYAYDVDAIDIAGVSFKPINRGSVVTLLDNETNFFSDYTCASYARFNSGYFIDCSGLYGNFGFIGIIVEPYSNELYFISQYPDMSETASDNVGDLPEGLTYYGFTLENILYGLNDGEYLKVELDNDDLENIIFNGDSSEIPENFYLWLTRNYDIVYVGDYTIKTVSGETIAHLTEKPAITHYTLTVNDTTKNLVLYYANGLQDSLTWDSSDSGKVFSGLGVSGILMFIPGDYDCYYYGTYEFTEFWETPIIPARDFTINLYKLTGDAKLLDKSEFIEPMLNVTGALKTECSLVDPVIRIAVDYESEHEKLLQSNYCYISEFNRYYFITGVTAYRTNLYVIQLHCDVLMTYRETVLNTGAVKIERSSIYRNTLLDDNKDIIEPSNSVSVLNFSDMTEKLQPDISSLSGLDKYKYTVDFFPINDNTESETYYIPTKGCVYVLTVLGDNDRFYDGVVDPNSFASNPEFGTFEKTDKKGEN